MEHIHVQLGKCVVRASPSQPPKGEAPKAAARASAGVRSNDKLLLTGVRLLRGAKKHSQSDCGDAYTTLNIPNPPKLMLRTGKWHGMRITPYKALPVAGPTFKCDING